MPTHDILIRNAMLFGSTTGFRLVRDRWQAAGFAGVDNLYRSPPGSTAQVLHPLRHPLGPAPPPPVLPNLGATGCTPVRTTALGAFALAELLSERLSADDADAAVAGWLGDTSVTLRCGGAIAFVDRTQADGPTAAAGLGAALGVWAPAWAGAPGASVDARGRAGGPAGAVTIARRGAATVDLVLAADRATADRLAAALAR